MRRLGAAGIGVLILVVIAAIVFAVVQANTPRRTVGVTAGVSGAGLTWGLSSRSGSPAGSAGDSRNTPRRIQLPSGTTTLASGAAGVAALADGRIWTTGRGSASLHPVTLPDGNAEVRSVDVGNGFYVAADDRGRVYAWGDNRLGELGNGSRRASTNPVRVAIPSSVGVSAVAAGEHFAAAVTDSGAVFAWGSDSEGQLGDGRTTDSMQPVRVELPDLNGDRVVRVAAGARHALALTRSGRVVAWGSNVLGQRATSSSRPAVVRLDRSAVSVTAGYGFSVAVLDDGSARSWGDNADGELGTGSTRPTTTPTPVRLGDRRLTEVVAGDRFVVAITSDGSCVAWGDGSGGQLGDGSTLDRSQPVALALPDGTKVRALATSARSVIALEEPVAVGRISVVARSTGRDRTVVISAVAHTDRGVSLGPVSSSALRVRMADSRCVASSCRAPRDGAYQIEARLTGTDVSGRTIVTIGPNVRQGAVLHRLPDRGIAWWIWAIVAAAALVVLLAAGTMAALLRCRGRESVDHV